MRWFRWRKDDYAANGTPNVSMYTLSVCPSCAKARKFFADRHIPFEFTNYDLAAPDVQHRILRELEAEEIQAFPLVRIGEQTVQGYDPKSYARLLDINH